MKFLHTADLHLDSAFCGAGPLAADVRREAQRSLLKRIFACAQEEACDMILMAGDIFDTVFVTPETARLFIGLCRDFGAPIVISPGNHDPYADGGFWSSAALPSNVFVFSAPELQIFDFPELEVSVAGYAFTSPALQKNPLTDAAINRDSTERHLLLCAHADIDVPMSRYAPATLGDITRHGFDYAALGHVHIARAFRNDVRYCGFPEGRGFDEEGDGQVLTVTLDGGACTVKEHVLSRIRYVRTEISADGAATAEDTLDMIKTEISKYSDKPTHLRIELCGTLCEDALPDLAACERELGAGLASLEITSSVLALPDGAYLEKDVTLKGELYRTLRPKLLSDDLSERRIALRALRIGLAAIEGKSFTDGGRAE
ncbi:MAG: DNA repair exonuclease [Clostridia bacterium]|nr:DNA repair exonuclease [Clostridia bacterium]